MTPFFKHALSHWEIHLETMYNFWENILFYTGSYNGNPMEKHRNLNNISVLQPLHFDVWLSYFNATIDELFIGEKAQLAKQRAYSIAVVMKLKLIDYSTLN
jgi:hemoglobin